MVLTQTLLAITDNNSSSSSSTTAPADCHGLVHLSGLHHQQQQQQALHHHNHHHPAAAAVAVLNGGGVVQGQSSSVVVTPGQLIIPNELTTSSVGSVTAVPLQPDSAALPSFKSQQLQQQQHLHQQSSGVVTMPNMGPTATQQQSTASASCRDPASAPLRKLSVDLIKTYKHINEVSQSDTFYLKAAFFSKFFGLVLCCMSGFENLIHHHR